MCYFTLVLLGESTCFLSAYACVSVHFKISVYYFGFVKENRRRRVLKPHSNRLQAVISKGTLFLLFISVIHSHWKFPSKNFLAQNVQHFSLSWIPFHLDHVFSKSRPNLNTFFSFFHQSRLRKYRQNICLLPQEGFSMGWG